MKKYNVAVVGATGAVGGEMLNILSERNFPYGEVYALASRDSIGKEVSFGDVKTLKIESLDSFDFSKVDFALFSAGGEVSKKFAPIAASKGAIVVDNSSAFRMDSDVSLIVPEVNPEDYSTYKNKNIIANPNCVVLQMVMALKPLHDEFGIKRIVASSYQSVSGAGKEAMDELFAQTKARFLYQETKNNVFPRDIAFNVIPQVGAISNDCDTEEEIKVANEIKKILGSQIETTITCVRVPVFVGHSVSVNVEFEDDIDMKTIENALKNFPGLVYHKDHSQYVTPKEIVCDYDVYVSRVRLDKTQANTINAWIVGDNLRKGAALNAVQIAETIIKDYN